MHKIVKSDGSIQFKGVATEQDYVNIAQSVKIAGCQMKATDFLQNIEVSGTKAQRAAFDKEYNSRG